MTQNRINIENVSQQLQSKPHVLLQLAQNALTVAESMRDNYFQNTAQFITTLQQTTQEFKKGEREKPIISITPVINKKWEDVRGEIVTFIDGGVGQVRVASQVPILLRVGSYQVKTGERNISEREQFGYYPVILGDIQGGSKDRKDFIDIVRITAELLGGLSALKREPKLSVLMFHGPLVYLVGNYAGHTPFTESDIDLFLSQYAADATQATELKQIFLDEARIHIYPQLQPGRAAELARLRLFEPLAWMSFLYRQLVIEAKKRSPVPLIVGVVERSVMREFSERTLLARVFQGMRERNREDHFNSLYKRTDLNTPKALLDRLGYTDTLLLSMLLKPGDFSEPWIMRKYDGLREGNVEINGEAFQTPFNWSSLRPGNSHSFPKVQGCYLCVSETTDPIRIEVFPELGANQMQLAAERVYLYASLLPGYGFPVGLDVVDKYAKVPAWLTRAYEKMIKHHIGTSLQKGEITDAQLRKILFQSIYMTHRDWIFRPPVS